VLRNISGACGRDSKSNKKVDKENNNLPQGLNLREIKFMKTLRTDILKLFNGQEIDTIPCFSGLINVTAAGLESIGLKFHEVHTDPDKMARAATSTYRISGFASAVVPLDLCVEAEALGAEIDFRVDEPQPIFPRVVKPLFSTTAEVSVDPAFAKNGRAPIVRKAIQLLKAQVGSEIVIGAWVPGPFTLLSILVNPANLMLDLRRAPEAIHAALDALTDVVTQSALAYHDAGADMLTVHEMGGTPGLLGPKRFETFVLPQLQKLLTALPRPRVLSVCGRTNGAMHLLAAAGADAISVDQTNDLATSRKELPYALIFGNIDPVDVLAYGTPDEIRRGVTKSIDAGVNAVWPGCDLYPLTPCENLRAFTNAD
jgi:MtaA/CmuA family methyltransferase